MALPLQDLAHNPLPPSTAQMLGWIEPSEDELLELEIYRFILGSIRTEDRNKGGLFLKRFLEGPQAVWETTQGKINDIKDLWDITKIKDEHLQYLKNIVGWTPDLEGITDELSYDILRRLIKNSVALWKQRGSEDALLNLLSLVVDSQVRIWNWFDFRWVLDETILDVAHDGRDPWMIDLPGPPEQSEYYSNLRMVDDGTLNHSLVREVVKLMRASLERILISYLDFLELFTNDFDTTQWNIGTTNFDVSDGKGKLLDDTLTEAVVVDVENALFWNDYICSWRLKATSTGGRIGMMFYASDKDNGYILTLMLWMGALAPVLLKLVSGVWTIVGTFGFGIPMNLEDVYYMYTIQVVNQGATNKITLSLDGTIVGSIFDNSFSRGTIGLIHEINATLTVDEIEMFQLPMETDLIDINQ